MTTIYITSFGWDQPAGAPAANLTFDLRTHFRDPHKRPEFRYLTARDQVVVDTVLSTPGIRPLVASIAGAVAAYASGPVAADITVAVGCVGGRHRAPSVAMLLAGMLTELGYEVAVDHRDIDLPVLTR
ncbi:ATPase [Nocardiopsis sediminis]|uniref:ATPase n=1 Tax=Nocardiopsis sediminis TaxID=1778267 RepID=A0ABV8FP89_9ACTN